MPIDDYRDFLKNLPVSWRRVQLQEIGIIYSGGTPSRSNPAYWEGTIPWITPGELTDFNGKRVFETDEKITKAGLSSSSAKLLPIDAIIVTTRATIGSVAIAGVPLSTNQGFKSIDLTAGETDPNFYYYLLDYITPEFIRRASGTTFLEISGDDFSRVIVPLPPLPEQRRIAEILDAADAAIRETERVIAKLRQVKQGLLHDLLTRGLDAHGHLRDPDVHPEQFKDSPLGRIPRAWEVKTIDEIAVHVGSGATPTGGSKVYQSEGVVFIRSQNVDFDGLLLEDVAYISEQIHQDMARSEIFAHDVLINITGASIGRCCPVPEWLGRANVNQHVCAIRQSNPTHANAVFLSSVLASHIGQHQVEILNAGSNREGLNYTQLRAFKIPWPIVSERKRIAAVLDAHDARIRAEEAVLAKRRQVKRGLMDGLLTGRVRV